MRLKGLDTRLASLLKHAKPDDRMFQSAPALTLKLFAFWKCHSPPPPPLNAKKPKMF